MNAHTPIILGDRQEQFCQQILEGKSATEAYVIAYGVSRKSAEASGPRLSGNVRVQARIAQLRAFEAAARRVSLPFLTGALYRIADKAEGSGQHSAAVQAMMGVAKLHGLLIDRVQADLMVRRPSASPESPDEMSEEQWLALHGIPQVTASITLEAEPSSIEEDEPK
jgi:phage terminase small subunit